MIHLLFVGPVWAFRAWLRGLELIAEAKVRRAAAAAGIAI